VRSSSCSAAAAAAEEEEDDDHDDDDDDDFRPSAAGAHRHDDLEVTGFEFADGPQQTGPLISRELEVNPEGFR
jgi:hypothetical protein